MNNFPTISNVSDMRKSFSYVQKDYKTRNIPFSFVEKHIPEGYSFFNYNFLTEHTFPEPSAISEEAREHHLLLRECRGVVFDTVTGKIVSRPFHKFFNINEKEETKQENLDLNQKFHLLEKMDGTMVCAILTRIPNQFTKDNQQLYTLHFRTKMGWDTDIALKIEKLIFMTSNIDERPKYLINHDGTLTMYQPEETTTNITYKHLELGRDVMWNYIHHSIKWISKGFTPIYEFVSPDNMIVLVYNEPLLKLLAIRHNVSGEYVHYQETLQDAQEHSVPMVVPLEVNGGMKEMMQTVVNMLGVEGFVLRFADSGKMYKIKSSWYVDKHKRKTKSIWGGYDEMAIYKAVALGTVDDIIASIEDQEGKDVISSFNSVFWDGARLATEELTKIVDEWRVVMLSQDPPNEGRWFHETVKKNNYGGVVSTFMKYFFERKDRDPMEIMIDRLQFIFKRHTGKKIPDVVPLVLEKYSGLVIKLKKSQYLEVTESYKNNRNADKK
ncbi:T4 RNA ligase [Acrasis kona]|uniref:T4 RNA ligase n=1 Tax=Acrasis kona TaxID=1008807 RepID=A0AAW2YX95_9EUKA